MATAAAYLCELLRTPTDGVCDIVVGGNHLNRNRQRGLKQCHRRDVRASQFVYEAVAVGIYSDSEAFLRLNPVVVVECIVGELPERDHVSGLVPRTDDQARRRLTGCDQAGRRNSLDLRYVP